MASITSPRSTPRARAIVDASDPAAAPPMSPRSEERVALGRSLAALKRSNDHTTAAASASHAIGEGLRCMVLQRPAHFTIYSCDHNKRHLRTGGDAFTVSIRGPSLVYPTLADKEDGTYDVEWQATVSGVYLITVMLNGEHIEGSPWAARAISPGADPSQCRLRAYSAPLRAIAGEPTGFEIEFFDALGQGVAMEPLELATVLKTAEACAVPVVRNASRKAAGGHPPERVYLHISAEAASLEDGTSLPDSRSRACVTVDKSGEYKLHVLMQPGHQPIIGSPLNIIVRPGAPCAGRCAVAATPAEKRMRAGDRRTFLVRTHDACGNPCDQGGARVSVSVPDAVRAVVADCHNGTYEVEWTCLISGLYDLAVIIDGESLRERVTLAVEPHELSLKKTKVSGDLGKAVAGERAVVRVHGRDEYGNAILPTADVGFGISLRGKDSRRPVEMICGDDLDFKATEYYFVSGGGGAEGERLPRATLQGYWLSDGVFELVYTCSGAGFYLLHLWHRDAHNQVHELGDSPHALEVRPAVPDARGSTLLEGARRLHNQVLPAGTIMSAYAQVADRFGNSRDAPSHELEMSLVTPKLTKKLELHAWQGRASSSSGGGGGGGGELEASGTYEANDEVGTAGSYTLRATVLGADVVGSPMTFQVIPGAPDGEHSTLVPPVRPMVAHEPAMFVVQPRDKWGNAPPFAELEHAVGVGAVVARVDGPTRPKVSVHARPDGSLDVTVVAELSGEYRLHVWIGGTSLPACPYSVKVFPNTAYAAEPQLLTLVTPDDDFYSSATAAAAASATSPSSRSPRGGVPRYNLDRSSRTTTPASRGPQPPSPPSTALPEAYVFSPRTSGRPAQQTMRLQPRSPGSVSSSSSSAPLRSSASESRLAASSSSKPETPRARVAAAAAAEEARRPKSAARGDPNASVRPRYSSSALALQDGDVSFATTRAAAEAPPPRSPARTSRTYSEQVEARGAPPTSPRTPQSSSRPESRVQKARLDFWRATPSPRRQIIN